MAERPTNQPTFYKEPVSGIRKRCARSEGSSRRRGAERRSTGGRPGPRSPSTARSRSLTTCGDASSSSSSSATSSRWQRSPISSGDLVRSTCTINDLMYKYLQISWNWIISGVIDKGTYVHVSWLTPTFVPNSKVRCYCTICKSHGYGYMCIVCAAQVENLQGVQ